MKNLKYTKFTLLAVMATALLLITSTGCSEKGSGVNTSDSDSFETSAINNAETSEIALLESSPESSEEVFVEYTQTRENGEVYIPQCGVGKPYDPLIVKVNSGESCKDIIEKQVEIAKDPTLRVRKGRDKHEHNEVSEIKDFYNFDKVKVDGYELYEIMFSDISIIYNYAPIDKIKSDSVDGVKEEELLKIFVVNATDERASGKSASEALVDYSKQNNNTMTEEGFVHTEGGYMYAQLGEKTFNLGMPDSLSYDSDLFDDPDHRANNMDKINKYTEESCEYLSGIARNVIENAELVTLQG